MVKKIKSIQKDKVFHIGNANENNSICKRSKTGLKVLKDWQKLDDYMKCKLCSRIIQKQHE